MTVSFEEYPSGRLKRVHVNQHVCRANKKAGREDPAIIVKVGGRSILCRKVHLPDGCVVIQDREGPLRGCGASIWVETRGRVILEIQVGEIDDEVQAWLEKARAEIEELFTEPAGDDALDHVDPTVDVSTL